MLASKNPSKFKTTAFLMVKTQILSDFYELTDILDSAILYES